MASESQINIHPRQEMLQQLLQCRHASEAICEPLQAEDSCIQTMPDVSPPKWHLAHTSWFFETFILVPHAASYRVYDENWDYLFNSYYVTHSTPFPRPHRGLLSRPTLQEILAYRKHVDEAMQALLLSATEEQYARFASLVTLGINHEQQHQELLYTDIKHIFAQNPLLPAYRQAPLTRVVGHGGPAISPVLDAAAYDRRPL